MCTNIPIIATFPLRTPPTNTVPFSETISAIHQSKDPKFKDQGNNSFCFVDVPNITEAKMAIEILNNRETAWGTARVNFATGGIVPSRNKYRGGGGHTESGEGHQPQVQQSGSGDASIATEPSQ